MQPTSSVTPNYIHLRVHTEFSLVDGIVRIKPLMATCAKHRMPAVALTDQCNLFAAVKFYKAALAQGIKPIIGADLWLANAAQPEKPYRFTLLCQSLQGYRNLTELVSKAYLQGQQHHQPTIEFSWLATHHDGLIALSGAGEGDIGNALLTQQIEQARERARQWQTLFGDRFYLELQRTGRTGEETYIAAAVELAEQLALPVVATNDVRFIDVNDFEAHEARVCIYQGCTLQEVNRPKLNSSQQYLRSPQEMQALFSDLPEALINTVEIAKRCNVVLELGDNYLPQYPIPEGLSTEQYLSQQVQQALDNYLQQRFDSADANYNTQCQPYRQRLQVELDVINSMGFAGYFLIVADFINWAKRNHIMVGPGRGSGAGSLVAFMLQITTLDPLDYDLLFERFLNPERVSMPDFDIDFCMEGRDRVIEYVAERYGRDAVSQIITYGTMAAKAVVRDTGRVLGFPYGFVDRIAKLIPFELGITLEKALAQDELLAEQYQTNDEVKEIIDLAKKLEGITRNAGKHAGGVVIAPSKLTDFAPLYCEPGQAGGVVTQFDKDDVEAVGLVKFDFLGLRTLTIIDWALQTIKQLHAKTIDIDNLPMNDVASFRLLKACQTTAVFQLESRGMKDLIRRLQPDCFEDIIALVALYRPGPLQSGMVDDFIDRKHGRAEVSYPHPDLEPILKPTYGVILYQEQVMQIAQVLAGYSLGAADLLRRAMGKKKPEEMAKQRQIFLDGALAQGVDQATAIHIFDLMEKFAGYGFNKSHSAAYALISYQTAWLKAHYPAAFMAAVLSSDMDNTDKVVSLITEIRQMGLTLLPPNINQGNYKFTALDEKTISYGLGAIKGVGENVLQAIVTERQARGPYQDLFDFCNRTLAAKLNRRTFEALIHAGALDELGAHRASLMATLPRALQQAEQQLTNQQHGQSDLFSLVANNTDSAALEFVAIKPWSDSERLQGEKNTLGLYLTGHPVKSYAQELQELNAVSLLSLQPKAGQRYMIAGIVETVRTKITKRGDRIAFVTLDDGSARQDVSIFSEAYRKYHDILQKDALLLFEVEVSRDDFSGGVRVITHSIMTLAQARQQHARYLILTVDEQLTDIGFNARLQAILQPYLRGACQVVINYRCATAQAKLVLGPQWQVTPAEDMLAALQEWLGSDNVNVVTKVTST
ncbi:MAG: DNA polymerase III subunit alpha [Gammaproteobacteria bacterium]